MLNGPCIEQKHKVPEHGIDTPEHGINAAKNATKRNGSMFAAGWHQGQEKGITLASYAAKRGKVNE